MHGRRERGWCQEETWRKGPLAVCFAAVRRKRGTLQLSGGVPCGRAKRVCRGAGVRRWLLVCADRQARLQGLLKGYGGEVSERGGRACVALPAGAR